MACGMAPPTPHAPTASGSGTTQPDPWAWRHVTATVPDQSRTAPCTAPTHVGALYGAVVLHTCVALIWYGSEASYGMNPACTHLLSSHSYGMDASKLASQSRGQFHAGVPSLGTRPTTLVYRCAMNKPVSPPCEHFAELSSVRLPSPGVPCMRPVPHRLRLRRADAIIPCRCDAMICGRSLIRYMLRAGTCQLRTQVPDQNFTDVRLHGTKPWSHHRHRLLWSCRPWRRPSRA